jgi:hypothetical protein
MRAFIVLTLGIALHCPASIATGQPTVNPLPPPPPGFTALAQSSSTAAMRAAGVADTAESVKPNEGWPNCFIDPKVHFRYSWTASPLGNRSVEMMAQAPEDPPSQAGGIRDEPAGKKRYKNGVLMWRKVISLAVGGGVNCHEVVTYSGLWTGWHSGRLIGIGITNLYQSKEPGQAWIDEYIDKMITVVTAHK